ncbi:hypothetical protein OG474_30045 [Kribbella sp. NBC_01505]|uniref:hypothetical protein n=1 Tax=Kribbella sp. NBC_01505 TaxID=2903580 RepID=UPI003866408F
MDTPLATVVELADKLPFTMGEDEKREAKLALETLSDDARFYGKPRWTNPFVTPPSVVRLVLKAANRHMKNYEGFTQSRAGDETVAWDGQGEDAGSARFSAAEKKQLQQLGNRAKIYSTPVSAWGTIRRHDRPDCLPAGFVPAEHGSPFPMFCGDGPWCECGGCT